MGTKRDQLINRLHIYKEKPKGKVPGQNRVSPPSDAGLPGEWKQEGKFTYVRESFVPCPVSNPFICPLLHPETLSDDRIVFYDTETTGLSGGAGTRIFLTGFGMPDEKGLRIRQYFLSDFPGEAEYLNLIASRFRRDSIFVSFNGKGYDSHLLRSRFAMNGIHLQFPEQIDLLHPSRRLWKSIIGSCSLGNIESEILGIHRDQDIPGYLVPEVYFSYLRTKETGQLLTVFRHNFQDVVSLAVLLETIRKISASPGDYHVDNGELGLMFCRIGDTVRGFELLQSAFLEGSVKAGKALGFNFKRSGEKDRAAAVWHELWKRDRDLIAAVELAKYLEHMARDFSGAQDLVEDIEFYIDRTGRGLVPRWIANDIGKRKIRLESKQRAASNPQKK